MIILCLLILYDSKILIDRNLFSVQWVAMLARFEAPDSESTSDSESSSSSVSKPGLKRKHSSSSESGSSSASDVPAKRVDMALSQLYMLDDKQGGPNMSQLLQSKGKTERESSQHWVRAVVNPSANGNFLSSCWCTWSPSSGLCQKLAKIAFCGLCSRRILGMSMKRTLIQDHPPQAPCNIKLHGLLKAWNAWAFPAPVSCLFHVHTTPCLFQSMTWEAILFAAKHSCSWWESARQD